MEDFSTSDPAFYEEDDYSFGSSSNVADDVLDASKRSRTGGKRTDDAAENRYFGRSENRYVRNLKALVFLLLFLVTLTVCLVIYLYTDNSQQDEFEVA
jgi:hypothetical protein